MSSTAELKDEYDLTRVPDDRAGRRQAGPPREHRGSAVLARLALPRRDRGSRSYAGSSCWRACRGHPAAGTVDPGAHHRRNRRCRRNRPRATGVFLLIDVTLLQNIGTYTNRWYEIGGGSNWWYHPVWWMVGTFLPWLGAWILANQTSRRGEPSPLVAFGMAGGCRGCARGCRGAARLPGCTLESRHLRLAFLPGLALATVLSAMGKRRD